MKDEKLREKAEKKMKEGWIRVNMMVEVLAVSQEAAETALKKHVEKMGAEDRIIIYKKEFKKTEKTRSPFKDVPEAFSQVVELEAVSENYEKLVYIVMNYAPSSIEIMEPGKIELDMGEAQGILNSLSDMMHKFASVGVGGVLVTT